jgi:hypothetical protein
MPWNNALPPSNRKQITRFYIHRSTPWNSFRLKELLRFSTHYISALARNLYLKGMALKEYKHKRSSDKTPEPFGGNPAGTQLQFVVQKHAASHLHYDFRLEVKGGAEELGDPQGTVYGPGDQAPGDAGRRPSL